MPTCGDGATRGVDVHGDVPLGVHAVKVEQLRNDQVGHVIVHRATSTYDALQGLE